MDKRGILVVVSGFSGAGKGTIMKRLLEDYSDSYALSISATTRLPRPGESHGREYFFVSKEEFEEMIEEDALIEYARYVNNYYGTPKDYVFRELEAGRDVILEIEIQGALKVKEAYPDTLLLFVSPPSAGELKDRLMNRGTEDIAAIESRLNRAWQEAQGVENYDYFVINDDLEECVQEINNIIKNEHARVARNHAVIENIRAELKSFAKGD
ncbi:MAG: guanylate kinase [Lachnospiraceae bacterium]|jgi:guanylate kinase|nr:guanylate kinase [Lachnospiraceae bacterium]